MENCPYCNAQIEICHDDGYGYEEDIVHQQDCRCGKTFTFTTSISIDYELSKSDCLNEWGEHVWKPQPTAPKCFTKMVCSICDEKRQPTPEEKIQFEIPDRL